MCSAQGNSKSERAARLVSRPTFGKSQSWCWRLPAGFPGPHRKSPGSCVTAQDPVTVSLRATGEMFA